MKRKAVHLADGIAWSAEPRHAMRNTAKPRSWKGGGECHET